MNRLKKLFLTYCLCMIWCFTWTALEYAIDGAITNRAVDNIMTVLALPMMYFTVSKLVDKEK